MEPFLVRLVQIERPGLSQDHGHIDPSIFILTTNGPASWWILVALANLYATGQTTRAAGLNALLPSQTGNVQYMLLTDGAGTVSWGAQPVAGLPSQTSNGGKLLTTDGTNASWSNAVTVSGSNATVIFQ